MIYVLLCARNIVTIKDNNDTVQQPIAFIAQKGKYDRDKFWNEILQFIYGYLHSPLDNIENVCTYFDPNICMKMQYERLQANNVSGV